MPAHPALITPLLSATRHPLPPLTKTSTCSTFPLLLLRRLLPTVLHLPNATCATAHDCSQRGPFLYYLIVVCCPSSIAVHRLLYAGLSIVHCSSLCCLPFCHRSRLRATPSQTIKVDCCFFGKLDSTGAHCPPHLQQWQHRYRRAPASATI